MAGAPRFPACCEARLSGPVRLHTVGTMPPVTTALIVANVAIFLIQSSILPGIALPFALWPVGSAAATGGQVDFHAWQIVTYGFLHGGLTHLLFNMFGLYMFGGAARAGGRAAALPRLLLRVRDHGRHHATARGARGVERLPHGGRIGRRVRPAPRLRARTSRRTSSSCSSCPIPIPARIFVVIYAVIELGLGVSGRADRRRALRAPGRPRRRRDHAHVLARLAATLGRLPLSSATRNVRRAELGIATSFRLAAAPTRASPPPRAPATPAPR